MTAPVVAIPAIINTIATLFQGSSYDATHQQILTWSSTIANDPALATAAARDAWLRLRCWSGDQTVITPANTAYLFGSGSVAQGCGCEVAHGCRADAKTAVQQLGAQYPQLFAGPATAPSVIGTAGNTLLSTLGVLPATGASSSSSSGLVMVVLLAVLAFILLRGKK